MLQPGEASHDSANDPPLAHTLNGSYAGLHLQAYKQDVFLGMPFALPPTGANRFRHPQSLIESWLGVRDASAYSRHCPGYGSHAREYLQSEDCLTINVIRPANVHSSPLPVGVYIYGGEPRGGGSGNQRYNMSFIVSAAANADLPFIGVSFNYRSSIWGFITGRQVIGEGNTNIGLYDQRKALEWIQENIASFNGDPRKVTIWGGSSGADNIGYHLAANGGRDDGLFRAAIMQSGGPNAQTSIPKYPVQDLYDELVAKAGCSSSEDSLNCLRQLSFEQMNNAFVDSPDSTSAMMASFGIPSIDGNYIANYGTLSIKNARMVKVPIISGIVSNEGTVQIPSYVHNWADLREHLIDQLSYFEGAVDRLMKYYPPISPDSNDNLEPPIKNIAISSRAELQRVDQIMGDLTVNAATKLICGSYTAFASCYSFRFDADVPTEFDPRLGVTHGAETGPVFQNVDGIGFNVNPFEGKGEGFHSMSRLVGIMWAGFITSLDPNVGLKDSDPAWPKYSSDMRQRIVFNETGSWVEKEDTRVEALEYINSIQHTVLER
ncbi:hypothetical protein EAF04_005894 [Stromatinia cepivora]|nr:hypothetical protein EAF04_005894 [Stromatinia cepivora]